MKKLVFVMSVVVLIILSSCVGVETPRLTKENPFIVSKVKVYDLENNAYTGGKFVDIFGQFFAYHQTVIAPKGMFNVGDTIKVCR